MRRLRRGEAARARLSRRNKAATIQLLPHTHLKHTAPRLLTMEGMAEGCTSLSVKTSRRCAMSARDLKVQAYREWSRSTELQYRYHTFDYYWSERYARVYRLPVRLAPVGRWLH